MPDYRAFLRIRHPSIDPAEISEALGLEAEHAWAAGSARTAAGGGRARSAHPDTFWIAELTRPGWERATFLAGLRAPGRAGEGARLPLELFLFAQLRQLQGKGEFLRRLAAEGGELVLQVALPAMPEFCLELGPGLLRSAGDLGLGLSLESGAELDAGD